MTKSGRETTHQRAEAHEPEPQPRPKKPRSKRARKAKPILFKATIEKMADASAGLQRERESSVEASIMDRIAKCLARGNHIGTPQNEAKAALYMASRLMKQHNVTQAEVLAREGAEQQAQYAGQSEVAIRRTNAANKLVINQGFVSPLIKAMCEFFDCKAYSTRHKKSRDKRMKWTFYGIAPNTIAAAAAFEMVYNLMLDWASVKPRARNCYCWGIANGLYDMAREERSKEMAAAHEAERKSFDERLREEDAQRQRELDRLREMSPQPEDTDSASESDDDMTDVLEPDFDIEDDEPIVCVGDIDEDIARYIKQESPTSDVPTQETKIKTEVNPEIKTEVNPEIKTEGDPADLPMNSITLDPMPSSLGWLSSTQLTLFRETAQRIADDYYLKSQSKKLKRAKYKPTGPRDKAAYTEGQTDSRKIDVRRKRLEGSAGELQEIQGKLSFEL